MRYPNWPCTWTRSYQHPGFPQCHFVILERYGNRLRHVHLHDNRGTGDDHLPLGAGTLDLTGCIRALKASGYDDTITLEVFTPDTQLVRFSAEKLRRLWDEL